MVNQQTQTPDRPRRRWSRLRDWPVRGRLVALIAIPTVVAVALGVIGVVGAVTSATGDRHAQTLARLGGQLTELVARVQNEQTASAVYVAGGRTDPGGLQGAYRSVDAASAAPLRTLTTDIDDSYPATTVGRARAAAFRINELRNLRQTVQSSQLPANVVITKYTAVVTELLAVNGEIAAETADPDLVGSTRALDAVSRVKTELGVQRSLVAAALTTGRFDLGGVPALADSISTQDSAFGQFQAAADSYQSQQYAFLVTGRDVDQTQTILNQITSSGGNWVTTAPPQAGQVWQSAVTGNLGKVRQVEQGLTDTISDRANVLSDNSVRTAVIAGVIVLALLIVVLIATGLVARSLVRPLRTLRLGALDVADDRLPAVVSRLRTEAPEQTDTEVEPIPVHSADEIGQVARAFDEVHRVATRLAGEQAQLRGQVNALFVGLSRRSQTLVERQLEVIDSLEAEEQDANRLRNLFTLDHLATRMRRNGENLLVLGGQEPSRRFTEAMPLYDVLRAAASEVERYERVHIDNDLPDTYVAEAAVTDLVHLVAELLDNATAFSPPEEPVRVRARQAPNGGVLVEISDSGIGLAEEDRTAANADLADPPVIQPAVSRHMGLFVVARLARRHGIGVQLVAGEPHGLTVLVGLPPEVAARRSTPPPVTAAPVAEEYPPVPGWPGRRFVAAMTASQAASASWFGADPLPTIGGNGSAPARTPSGHPITSAGETTVGLPLRLPGANYVPGSLHGDAAAPTAPPSAPAGSPEPGQGQWEQSPDALRSRFAAYQTGARRGHAAGRHAATPPEAAQPEAAQPQAAQPETVQPQAVQPETVQPQATPPEPTRPEVAPVDGAGFDGSAHEEAVPDATTGMAASGLAVTGLTAAGLAATGDTTASDTASDTALGDTALGDAGINGAATEAAPTGTEPTDGEPFDSTAPTAAPAEAAAPPPMPPMPPPPVPPAPRWPSEEPPDTPPDAATGQPGAQPGTPAGPPPTASPITSAGQTSVGLPLRRPGANYVPGSMRTQQRPPQEPDPASASRGEQPDPQSERPRDPAPRYPRAQPDRQSVRFADGARAAREAMRRGDMREDMPGESSGDNGHQQETYEQESWDQGPEALRARFAAFQSGSRRGHEAAAAGTAWTEPGGVNGQDRKPTR